MEKPSLSVSMLPISPACQAGRSVASACHSLRPHLHMLTAAIVCVDLVGDALAGCPIVGLLPIPSHWGAYHDHDARVVAQLLQGQVEGRILPRLYQQLIDNRPEHRHCIRCKPGVSSKLVIKRALLLSGIYLWWDVLPTCGPKGQHFTELALSCTHHFDAAETKRSQNCHNAHLPLLYQQ